MKGYKAFNSGLVCRGKQYAENATFEEKEAEVCSSGMHFCANPFDVLTYYDLVNENGEFNDFAKVESLADAVTDDGKKYCTTKLKIGAKLSFSGFVKACVDFVIEKTNFKESSGNGARIGSSGDDARIGSSGNGARIGSSGYGARIGSSGQCSVICCAGHNSAVKAKKGSWITLAEWRWDDEEEQNIPICVKTEFVDGEKIKEDVFYTLKNGEFKEVGV